MAYSSITKPSDYFNTTLYTGNGSTDRAVTVGFQPDWIWCKERSQTESHMLHDVHMNAGDYIRSNTADGLSNSGEMFKSITSTGFTVGTRGEVNENSQTYVNWSWKGGGTPSANTDGSITSSVSVNTTSGFSIVKFTGTGANGTVGHGLGVTPAMIIQKNLSTDNSAWSVWHKSFNGNQVIYLNETGAVGSNTSSWNSTTPTASVFSVGTGSYPNGSGNSQIYYVFAEKKGFSKIGTYIGNGDADGTFVYTGFKPAFLLYKSADQNSNWLMWDNKRPGYNEIQKLVMPNLSNAEADSGSDALDFLSNGFKFRGTGAATNGSGQAVIYMAFAEEPLVANVGNSIPATAR